MIRPERDPHFVLGREHGVDGLSVYQFADAENQRRYDAGYAAGRVMREELLRRQLTSQQILNDPTWHQLRPGAKWRV